LDGSGRDLLQGNNFIFVSTDEVELFVMILGNSVLSERFRYNSLFRLWTRYL